MSRPLRFVPTANSLVEVTSRTIQGRLLLRATPPINQAIVGVLGRGQKKYGMVVHCAVALSTTCIFCLANLSQAENGLQIENLIAEVVAENAAKRRAEGQMVLGAQRLQKQDPHTRPNRTKRSPTPRFHAMHAAVKRELRAAYSAFEATFRPGNGASLLATGPLRPWLIARAPIDSQIRIEERLE